MPRLVQVEPPGLTFLEAANRDGKANEARIIRPLNRKPIEDCPQVRLKG